MIYPLTRIFCGNDFTPEIVNLKQAVEDGDLIVAHDANRGNKGSKNEIGETDDIIFRNAKIYAAVFDGWFLINGDFLCPMFSHIISTKSKNFALTVHAQNPRRTNQFYFSP